MHEQLSSTTSTGSPPQMAADDPEVAQRGNVAANRPLRSSPSVRYVAVILGCAALGAATCRHAMAQQETTAPPTSVTDLLAPDVSSRQQDFDLFGQQPAIQHQIDGLAAPTGETVQPLHAVTSVISPTGPAQLVSIVTEHRQSTLPFRRIYRMSRAAGLGQTNISHQGASGILEKTYRVTYRADVPVSYAYQSRRVIKAPVDMVIDAGYTDRAARALPSRSGLYTRAREMDMVATGYSPMEGSGTGRCANGMRAGYGVVAVDPRVIPLGSKLFVEGYGYAFAGDTGGAIRGRRIDLGQNTYHAASMVGRRKVHVYVLSDAVGR